MAKWILNAFMTSFFHELCILECLKSWFRLGLCTQQDLHDIGGTMEEGGAEAMDFLA